MVSLSLGSTSQRRAGAARGHAAVEGPRARRRRARIDRRAAAGRPRPRSAGRCGSACCGGRLQDAPTARQLELRLVRASGEVVQEVDAAAARRPPDRPARCAPATSSATSRPFSSAPAVPAEPLSVDVGVLDAPESARHRGVRLGSVTATGRAHVFDAAGDAAGSRVRQRDAAARAIGSSPRQARAGESDRASALARRRRDAAGLQSLRPRARPGWASRSWPSAMPSRRTATRRRRAGWSAKSSRTSTTIALPASLAPATIPIEVGVYDAAFGRRAAAAERRQPRHPERAPCVATP